MPTSMMLTGIGSANAAGEINTQPVITVPGAQSVDSDATLTFEGATLISIADAEDHEQTVVLAVSQGTLTLSQTTGLSFSAGDGTADATMTFTGSLANVNAALDGLIYDPTNSYVGADTLTVDATDALGVAAAQKTVAITVTSVITGLSNLSAWFDPNYKTYKDLSETPAAVGDIVRQWVSKHDDTLVAEAASDSTSPILREGANGERYLEFDGVNDRLVVTQVLAAGTLVFGAKRDASDQNYGGVFGLSNDAFLYAVAWNLAATTDSFLFRNEDSNAEGTATLATGSVLDWNAYSVTYAGNGGTNRGRRRGDTDATISGATPSANTAWCIGARNGTYGKQNISHVVRYTDAKSTTDRATVEGYIHTHLPT